MAHDPARVLDLAAALARRAGAAIMAARAEGTTVERKADGTPVSAADRASEALITAGLAPLSIPVIAEEAEAGGAGGRASAEYWLVDPLDGTREFIAGKDAFAVCIGLVRDGRPVLGAVMLPAHDELFLGIPGRGAWRESSGARRPIHARRLPAQGPVVYASSHYRDDPRIAAFAAQHHAQRVVHLGSAEKFCRLAEGVGDLYPRFGSTMEWDTAAAQAVLEAAGGACLAPDGRPLAYGKPGWRNGDFVARGAA